jgi:hypothetical protein
MQKNSTSLAPTADGEEKFRGVPLCTLWLLCALCGEKLVPLAPTPYRSSADNAKKFLATRFDLTGIHIAKRMKKPNAYSVQLPAILALRH